MRQEKKSTEFGTIPNLPGYMSIKDAAKFLKLSIRRVHEYVQEGKLTGFRAAHALMVPEAEVRNFKRSKTGRPRTRIPVWRIPVGENYLSFTSLFTRILPGQSARFNKKLAEIRASG